MRAQSDHCCAGAGDSARRARPDYLLWGSLAIIALASGADFLMRDAIAPLPPLQRFSETISELVYKMWWGMALGILFAGLLGKIPRAFVMSVLGTGGTMKGILRAAFAGLMLDLCNHGILLVAMRLYERGASIGQVMAMLIASPWNSLSLTIILFALVGWEWALFFVFGSALVAVVSGLVFERLVRRGVLPENPAETAIPEDFRFWREAGKGIRETRFDRAFFREVGIGGLQGSRMILRWIFFGMVLAALVRAFAAPETFQQLFGPTLAGLGLTVLVATILEICSEGSTPVAADILNRARAPGNAFAFLMVGVSTDYTEIMALRETTRSWRIAAFLPLVTVPQILAIAWMANL